MQSIDAGAFPPYLSLAERGILEERKKTLMNGLSSCNLCPRNCGINRLDDERGVCKTGRYVYVASAAPHFGEEPPIIGRGGSGTIFFTSCNLKCLFCQNHDISQPAEISSLKVMSPTSLAREMLNLQGTGCENINLVTPSHVVPQIVEALAIAIEKGLKIPIVYNSSGYDNLETIRLLDGVVDIYMPDLKYFDSSMSNKYSMAEDYPQTAKPAIKEMYKQVGPLNLDENGTAKRGLLVRHLVLPSNISGTLDCLKFLKDEIGTDIGLSLMAQYYPSYKANEYPEIARILNSEEYENAVNAAIDMGFDNTWIQSIESNGLFRPDFSRESPLIQKIQLEEKYD